MGLRIGFYPTRLSDDDLETLIALAIHGWDHARIFNGWLVGLLQDEQIRRLERRPSGAGVEVPRLPMNWPAEALGQALAMVAGLSYSAPSYAAGRFVDDIVHTLNAIVARRLVANTL